MAADREQVAPADVLEILKGLKRQVSAVQYGIGVSPTEFKLANAIACILDILTHERESNHP